MVGAIFYQPSAAQEPGGCARLLHVQLAHLRLKQPQQQVEEWVCKRRSKPPWINTDSPCKMVVMMKEAGREVAEEEGTEIGIERK